MAVWISADKAGGCSGQKGFGASPPASPASLINLKKEYLKLSFIEWAVFLFAIAAIAVCIGFSLFGKYGKNTRNMFLAIGFYMFLLASLRAVVPAMEFPC